MQPVAPDTFSTLEDALAEIRRLRDQVNDLQREITRLTARVADGAGAAGRSSQEADAGSRGAAGPHDVATARAADGRATPDNAAALRQLEQFRETIARLREQRAQVSEEFRNLTRGAQRDDRARAAQLASRPGAPEPPPEVTSAVQDAIVTAASAAMPRAEVVPPRDQPAAEGTADGGPGAAFRQGLDAEPPVDTAEDQRRVPPASLGPDLAFSGEPPRASMRRRWLVAAVVLAAAAMATWFLVDRTLRRSQGVVSGRAAGLAGERQPAAAAEKELGVAPPPGGTAGPALPGASAPKPPAEAERSSRPAGQTAALRIRLEATREVWLRAVADGRQITARLFKPGEVLELEADSGALVRAGDAGAVRLVVNGVDRGPVGRDGAVLTRVFDAATENRKPRR